MTWFSSQKTKAESWRGELPSNNIPIIKFWWAELMTLAILGRKQLNSHFKATLLQSLIMSPEKICQKFKMKTILKACIWVKQPFIRDRSSGFTFCTAQTQQPTWVLALELFWGSTRVSMSTVSTPQDHNIKFKPHLFKQPRTCLKYQTSSAKCLPKPKN